MLNHPCNNDDLIFIAQLKVSTLFLFRDQRFRGYCSLSFDPWDATQLEALSEDEYNAFCQDLRACATAIRRAVQPDHMNYELLGNSNPHLHWHIIPRYKDDPRWGRPIWEDYQRGEFSINRHMLADGDYAALVRQIQEQLAKDGWQAEHTSLH